MQLLSEFEKLKWIEHEENPLLKPHIFSHVLGDPTTITPDESPDKKFHLFAFSILGVEHYSSEDGVKWKKLNTKGLPWVAARPFVYKENGTFYLFYENILFIFPFTKTMFSRIEMISSTDLINWSKPKIILKPELKWQENVCSNPCIVKEEEGYRLYYSAGKVFLSDSFYFEPKYISVAFSRNIDGPYTTLKNPIISPSDKDSHMNLGAGSIKVFKKSNGYSGFINGIYLDTEGKSRSAIKHIHSNNGMDWFGFNSKHMVIPDKGWKKAYVYACDVREYNGELWMYFNARDGWFIGKERIGLIKGVLKHE